MDANAKSMTWYSKITDERGRIVKEFLIHNDLHVANRPCDVPTFLSTQGESNIDLTVVSGNIITAVQDWNVSNICTTSDHNLILYSYCRGLSKRRVFYKQQKINIKKANWDKFEELVETSFNDEVLHKLATLNCESAVKLFNANLEDVCSRSIPRKKHGIKTVPWWNNEIANLRKNTKMAKRQLTRARKMNIIDSIQICEEAYRKSRNKYVSLIRKSKKESWKEFVTTKGNKNPWSIVYKIVREKIRHLRRLAPWYCLRDARWVGEKPFVH